MSGRKTFVGGDILLASELNGFLMDQAVMVFDDAADRTTAIPSPSEGMVTYLKDTNSIDKYVTSWVPASNGFTASQTITATNASWPVPALASPIVKVTVIGAGGGGGGGQSPGVAGTSGGTGGTTTFNAGGAGSVSASGGQGGVASSGGGRAPNAGQASGNGGGGARGPEGSIGGASGNGGAMVVSYLNLSLVSTVDVTIGLGGSAGGGGNSGATGGRGEVIVEYVAA